MKQAIIGVIIIIIAVISGNSLVQYAETEYNDAVKELEIAQTKYKEARQKLISQIQKPEVGK